VATRIRQSLLVVVLILGAVTPAPSAIRSEIPSDLHRLKGAVGQSPSWSSPSRLTLTSAVGEQLEFLVSWSDYLVAARVRMEIKESDPIRPETVNLLMRTQTIGLVRSLFIAVDDEFTSQVNPSSVIPLRFNKRIREGQRREESTILFDHQAGLARIDSEKSVSIDPQTRDVVALFYYLRTLDWSSDQQYRLTGIYEDRPFTLLVKPERRAMAESPTGPIEAIEIALRTEDTEGGAKLIEDTYRLRIWLTDDEKRIPVLITAKPTFGEIRVRLVK
jgi:hypothetical protein